MLRLNFNYLKGRIPEISFFDIFFLVKCKIAFSCKKQGVTSHLSLLEHVMVSPLFVLLIRQGDFFICNTLFLLAGDIRKKTSIFSFKSHLRCRPKSQLFETLF